MNNFPFFNHWVIKLIFQPEEIINNDLVVKIAQNIIKNLNLEVVKQTEFQFSQQGLTKIFILSQSHLIFHTWPEKNALHIDLLTCSQVPEPVLLNTAWQNLKVKEAKLKKLVY